MIVFDKIYFSKILDLILFYANIFYAWQYFYIILRVILYLERLKYSV